MLLERDADARRRHTAATPSTQVDNINWVADIDTLVGDTTGPTTTLMTGTAGANGSNMGTQPVPGSWGLFLDLVNGWVGPNEGNTTRVHTTVDHSLTWRVITP